MLAWVVEAARRCPQLGGVVVAADSDEVMVLCRQHGWPAVMTDPALHSGSDRVHAVAQLPEYRADIYVNLQADEPMLQPEHIAALLAPFQAGAQVSTLKVLCTAENLANPNAVKVVTAQDGRALYFSRATLPYDRERAGLPVYKHLGLYAYTAAALKQFHALPPGMLEQAERLEQLRLLEHNMPIHVQETPWDTIGVDTEDDLRRVEALLLAGRD